MRTFGILNALALALASCSPSEKTRADQDASPGLADLIGSGGVLEEPEATGLLPLCEGKERDGGGRCPGEEHLVVGEDAFVCATQKYRFAKTPQAFSALNPNADVLWPGSLVQGKSVASGILDPVPIRSRAPGHLVLTLATGGAGPFSQTVEKPSLASATDAVNTILSHNLDGPTPAKFSYRIEEIHDLEQLKVAFDINLKTGVPWGGEGGLGFDANDGKNRVLVEFTQEYFTIAFEPPQGMGDVFDASVTARDLAPYVRPGNPLLYVSSVTYGRKFYFLFESKAEAKDLKAAVEASYNAVLTSIGGGLEASYRKILNESTIRSFGLGGSANEAIKAATGAGLDAEGRSKADIINAFLLQEADFDGDTPGAPISYTVRYLENSEQVLLGLATEYTARTCAPVPKAEEPAVWALKVTLRKIRVHEAACDGGFGYGEFYTCLKARNGASGEFTDVLCQGREHARALGKGEEVVFGDARILKIPQVPGQTFEVRASVMERDPQPIDDEAILGSRTTSYELGGSGTWIDFGDGKKSVRATRNRCTVEVFYDMEWIDGP